MTNGSGGSSGGGGEVLGFPAFPKGLRRIPRFARSWWGRAWLTAMEETALDSIQLRKGRRYAYGGHVGSITVSPGRLAATVYDDAGATYRTVVEVERLTDRQWERLLGAITAKAGHLAALLDGDVPHELVDAAQDVDVRLLPGLGDLQPHCSCPDWEFPCRHAAALSYQSAWLIDADPFVLLLLRGRGAAELLGDLRRQPPAPERGTGLVGVPAAGCSGGRWPSCRPYRRICRSRTPTDCCRRSWPDRGWIRGRCGGWSPTRRTGRGRCAWWPGGGRGSADRRRGPAVGNCRLALMVIDRWVGLSNVVTRDRIDEKVWPSIDDHRFLGDPEKHWWGPCRGGG